MASRPLLVLVGLLLVGTLLFELWRSARQRTRETEWAAKQQLAEQLRRQATELRQSAPTSAKPVVTSGSAAGLAPLTSPCPLGSNLVRTRTPFCIDLYEYPGGRTIPRTQVTLEQASQLCISRGERLCTESEWESSCRGRRGASYPYGQTFDATRCNTKGGRGEIAPAGTFTTCRSASGAYDMSGNVAEWVSSGGQKGGSAISTDPVVRCSHTVHAAEASKSNFVGFRCCATPGKPGP